MLRILLLISIVCVTKSTSLHIPGQVRDWPCPLAVDIIPCTCTTDEEFYLHLDCSRVKTEDELKAATGAKFPFNDFTTLTIVPDSTQTSSLHTLDKDSFGDLNFISVTITDTSLRYVKEEAFSKSYDKLVQLDLKHNMLNEFPFESIFDYNKLRLLDLSYNSLPDLPPIVSTSLLYLSMAHNSNLKLYSDSIIKATMLNYIDFDDISLHTIPKGFTFNLTQPEVLLFSFNNLEYLDEFDIYPLADTIKTLAFTNNLINDTHRDAIYGLASDGKLMMDHNNLYEIHKYKWERVFKMMVNKDAVEMSGNSLRCGCDVKWIINDPTYLSIVSENTLCFTGELLHDLDPAGLIDCP